MNTQVKPTDAEVIARLRDRLGWRMPIVPSPEEAEAERNGAVERAKAERRLAGGRLYEAAYRLGYAEGQHRDLYRAYAELAALYLRDCPEDDFPPSRPGAGNPAARDAAASGATDLDRAGAFS